MSETSRILCTVLETQTDILLETDLMIVVTLIVSDYKNIIRKFWTKLFYSYI